MSEKNRKLTLDKETREALWKRLTEVIEEYTEGVDGASVAPTLELDNIRSLARRFSFDKPAEPLEALDFIVEGLWRYQTHTSHSRYFGLFNPAPATMGIVADALVALFNPQLAAWRVSPLANEIEQHVIRSFGTRFGYDPADVDGTFTSGGAEANQTAVLTALTREFPDVGQRGLRALTAQPVFYVSTEAHDSFLKAARMTGLGVEAVRKVPVDRDLRMDCEELAANIERDRLNGMAPFMVVATAGNTSAGAVDSIGVIAEIAERNGLWLHVDAAWGGAAILVPELRELFGGVERADSITLDPHKWLSAPKGAGIYVTRHRDILGETFPVAPGYMPAALAGAGGADPYSHSMQWSRRFSGLAIFMSLAVAGWEGYAAAIRRAVEMGKLMREQLAVSDWQVVNRTPLPVVCFVDQLDASDSAAHLEAINNEVLSSGQAWISVTRLSNTGPALRACVTNHRTEAEDITLFLDCLNNARAKVACNRKLAECAS